jgi:hypothetical protein
MTPLPARRRLGPFWRALVEVAFIIFLFYSNLLMGEFTAANCKGKTLLAALHNIVTPVNFLIALASAFIGYATVEFLRRRL